jgi:hypothetical protein
MTLAERIVIALLSNSERITTLESENAELHAKLANLGDLDKVVDLLPAEPVTEPEPEREVPQEKLPDWATQPDPALVPVQIDVPVSM